MLSPKGGDDVAVYMISYDLKAPGRNYDDLYKEIKSLGSNISVLKSQWFVDTAMTAQQISDTLRSKMDANDNVLVNKFINDYHGYLPKTIWTWLSEHLK
jgi:hypothetical protein